MRRRFWISLALGAVLGGTAVLGFGPCVRAQAERKAAAYGARIEVRAVAPSTAPRASEIQKCPG
jgi:hypothetical protein